MWIGILGFGVMLTLCGYIAVICYHVELNVRDSLLGRGAIGQGICYAEVLWIRRLAYRVRGKNQEGGLCRCKCWV